MNNHYQISEGDFVTIDFDCLTPQNVKLSVIRIASLPQTYSTVITNDTAPNSIGLSNFYNIMKHVLSEESKFYIDKTVEKKCDLKLEFSDEDTCLKLFVKYVTDLSIDFELKLFMVSPTIIIGQVITTTTRSLTHRECIDNYLNPTISHDNSIYIDAKNHVANCKLCKDELEKRKQQQLPIHFSGLASLLNEIFRTSNYLHAFSHDHEDVKRVFALFSSFKQRFKMDKLIELFITKDCLNKDVISFRENSTFLSKYVFEILKKELEQILISRLYDENDGCITNHFYNNHFPHFESIVQPS